MTTGNYVPRRGDVVHVDLNPQKGHEQAGKRPALVLSPVDYNRRIGLAVVCPITNQKKGYPWEVDIPDKTYVTGLVLADQLKSIAWRDRNAEFVCVPPDGLLEEVVAKAFALLGPEEEEES